MLVFIDESGDAGFELEDGSSRFFTIALVAFEDNDEALACDQRITLLRRELGWTPQEEFHFKRNSDRVRRAFLTAVNPYNFFYYGIVLNKDPEKLWGEGFQHKQSFYKYACGLLFQNAKEKIDEATVVLDRSGTLDFRNQLARYLRTKTNERSGVRIRKLKMERSSSNNLLQLVDYVAGAINRSLQGKKFAGDYRRMLARHEIDVQVWPK